MLRPVIRILMLLILVLLGFVAIHAVTQAHGQAVHRTPMPHRSVSAPSVSTVPRDPLTDYKPNQEFFESDGLGQYDGARNTSPRGSYSGYYTSGYWVDVPPSYDRDNRAPATLLVWLHGCVGLAKWDVQALSSIYNRNSNFILIALSGPESGNGYRAPSCWNAVGRRDVTKVLTDIKSVETHFNINRRRVFIGGYSSGGDLAWQTIFTHARTFAGIVAINTNPVRDNAFGLKWGLDAINHAVAGAAWKFHVVQVDHSDDTVYHVARCGYRGYPACPGGNSFGTTNPDAGVTPAIDALKAAGFPVIYKILPGQHFDTYEPKNCYDTHPDTCTSGTYQDIVNDLLPYLATPSWEAPAS